MGPQVCGYVDDAALQLALFLRDVVTLTVSHKGHDRVSRSTLQLRRPPKQHTPAALTTLSHNKYNKNSNFNSDIHRCAVFSLPFQTVTNASLPSLRNALEEKPYRLN